MTRTPEGDSLALAAEKAWRLLDTGEAFGPGATKAMCDLQDAVQAYMQRTVATDPNPCPVCGWRGGHRPFCGLEGA